MATLSSRRPYSTDPKGKLPERTQANGHHQNHEHGHQHEHGHEHENGHEHEHEHDHSHSHSILGALAPHTHVENGPRPDAEKLVEALHGRGDRGSRITLIGLFANVGLTAAKGLAGWYMNSAALFADAGHSLGDLLGDFVTLFCWRLSRKPPSERFPYGYGKFEVIGTTIVSLLLTGGALGIGLHSWTLLVEALSESTATLPPGILHDVLANVTSVAQSVPVIAAEAHDHAHALDPNAAWFAAVGVIGKEWLYRVTKRVSDEERSPVLYANALHHRSDAYGSLVALIAILGTWYFPHLPLDPIGGVIVSILILQQGWAVLMSAFRQLTDAGVSPKTKADLWRTLEPLLPAPSSPHVPTESQVESRTENLLGIRNLRAKRAGALMFVDLVAEVPHTLSIEEASALEASIVRTLKEARKEISEVTVKFQPVHASRRDVKID